MKMLRTAPSVRLHSTILIAFIAVVLLVFSAQAFAKTSDEVRAEANAMMEKLDAIQTEIFGSHV